MGTTAQKTINRLAGLQGRMVGLFLGRRVVWTGQHSTQQVRQMDGLGWDSIGWMDDDADHTVPTLGQKCLVLLEHNSSKGGQVSAIID